MHRINNQDGDKVILKIDDMVIELSTAVVNGKHSRIEIKAPKSVKVYREVPCFDDLTGDMLLAG